MRPIIFLAILVIFGSLPVAGIGNTCPPIPFVPESGGAGIERLNNWCRSVGGTWDGTKCVNCPTSGTASGASTGTTNGYVPFLSELLSLLSNANANSKVAAERRAAAIRYLREQHQEAVRRQQTAHAQWLDSVLQRLTTGDLALKQEGGAGELQLKLGSEPILFREYMSTPATSTTKAQISLKTGDEAVAPTINSANAATTTATATNANNAMQAEISPEMKALAEELSKLSPEQQQKLLEAIKSTETKVAVDTTVSTTAPEKAADTQLSLKLTETKTAATEPNGSPEALAKQAADDFSRLQQTTVKATQSTSDASKSSPDSAKKGEDLTVKASTAQQTANDRTAAQATQVAPLPAATVVINPQPPVNSSLSRIMKQKIDVPMWRPEGWVGAASKGERTLKFVENIKKSGVCDSPEQQDALARLVIKSNQLAGVERLINRLNATSPRLQAEIAETISELEKDRDEFVETIAEKLGDDLFDLRSRVRNQDFLKATASLAEVNNLREKVEMWNELVEAAKSKGKLDKATTLAGLLGEMSDALKGIRSPELKALRRQLKPFSFFSAQYEQAEFVIEMFDTFATLRAYDLNVERLNREIDARNRALAGIEPLHKRLSSDIDKLMNAPPITACSVSKP